MEVTDAVFYMVATETEVTVVQFMMIPARIRSHTQAPTVRMCRHDDSILPPLPSARPSEDLAPAPVACYIVLHEDRFRHHPARRQA